MYGCYDQPFGDSNRTHLYANYLGRISTRTVFFTNSFCHFTRKQSRFIKGLFLIESIENYTACWLKSIPYYNNGFLRLLNALLNFFLLLVYGLFSKARPDVIIGTSVPITTALAGVIVARFHRAKFIYEIRDLWPEALVSLGGIKRGGFAHKVMLRIEEYILLHSDSVITALPHVEKHVRSRGLRDNAKVCWIPNPVPVDNIDIKTTYLKSFNKFNIVYIGGFGRFHDIKTIIDAATYLDESNVKGIAIHLFGSGEFYSHYENLTKNKLLSNVFFHGRVSKESIFPLQREADALLATVPNSDVFKFGINPNKIINYMLSGKPIIYSGPLSTNNPVAESGSGICIPAGDAKSLCDSFVELFKQSETDSFKNYGLNGLSYSNNNYSISVLGGRYFNILSDLVSKNI